MELFAALEDMGADQLAQNRAEGVLWLMELFELAAPGVFAEEEKRARCGVLTTIGLISGMLLDERIRGGRPLDEFASTLVDMLVYGAVNRPPTGTK